METLPGQLGARASGLYKLLTEGHHDVKLTRDQKHRILLADASGVLETQEERRNSNNGSCLWRVGPEGVEATTKGL